VFALRRFEVLNAIFVDLVVTNAVPPPPLFVFVVACIPHSAPATATYFRQNGECVPCPRQAWLLILLFFIMAVVLCIGGWLLNRKNVNIAFLSIGVDYFQVLAMFSNAKVKVCHVPSTLVFHCMCMTRALSVAGFDAVWWGAQPLRQW
jgi:hypothetical protein